MVNEQTNSPGQLMALLTEVTDPEIPVLNIVEMGIVRSVRQENGTVIVQITPTYSGCPALDTIRQSIRDCLQEAGYSEVQVEVIHTPAWSSDFLTAEAKARLQQYGIAPPLHSEEALVPLPRVGSKLHCPRCGTPSPELLSEFGATACKALYRCRSCLEPFEYFKAF